MFVAKQIPYVDSIKYKVKMSHLVAVVTTGHHFMYSRLNILSICEHILCLFLSSPNQDVLWCSQFLLSMWLSELSITQKTP